MNRRFFANQAGETIVEVLVALAALGLVLSSSAVIVSRSMQTMQTVDEQSMALGIAQGQIERVKQYVSANPAALTTSGSSIRTMAGFCMSDDSSNAVFTGSACTRSAPQSYVVNNRITTTSGYYLLATSVTFSTLTGNNSNITLYYRMYE